MADKKLIIKPRRYGGETTVISVRLTKEMLTIIDNVATETGRTRNEILVTALEFALDNMEINEK